MKISAISSLAALALLASCSQSDADPQAEKMEAEPAAAAKAAPDPEDVVAGTEEPADAAQSIPAPFHGVWDYVKGTCAPESDLRINISPNEVVFYESLGKVQSVDTIDENTIAVGLAMEGEGETWEITRSFALINDGSGMTQSDAPDGGGFDPFELKRCE